MIEWGIVWNFETKSQRFFQNKEQKRPSETHVYRDSEGQPLCCAVIHFGPLEKLPGDAVVKGYSILSFVLQYKDKKVSSCELDLLAFFAKKIGEQIPVFLVDENTPCYKPVENYIALKQATSLLDVGILCHEFEHARQYRNPRFKEVIEADLQHVMVIHQPAFARIKMQFPKLRTIAVLADRANGNGDMTELIGKLQSLRDSFDGKLTDIDLLWKDVTILQDELDEREDVDETETLYFQAEITSLTEQIAVLQVEGLNAREQYEQAFSGLEELLQIPKKILERNATAYATTDFREIRDINGLDLLVSTRLLRKSREEYERQAYGERNSRWYKERFFDVQTQVWKKKTEELACEPTIQGALAWMRAEIEDLYKGYVTTMPENLHFALGAYEADSSTFSK